MTQIRCQATFTAAADAERFAGVVGARPRDFGVTEVTWEGLAVWWEPDCVAEVHGLGYHLDQMQGTADAFGHASVRMPGMEFRCRS